MDIIASLTSELNVGRGQVEAAVKLIDEGNTIPFIARYRKEATGSLNDEVLRTLDERLRYLRGLEEKKAQVMASIADQGKLTGELKKKIGEARTMVAVDDLYLPYRPKRKTRASMARETGTGAPGRLDRLPERRNLSGGRGKALCFRGKGRGFRKDGHCRGKGYPGRADR